MRYRFYREHKYVSSALNDLERLIAQTDFADQNAVQKVKDTFLTLAHMLTMHAQFEEERIHSLLRAKNATVHTHAEHEHAEQLAHIKDLANSIEEVLHAVCDDEKIEKGYKFYLAYRKFVADNLLHLHDEETVILTELQRLYTDDELRNVSAQAYREMTPDDMTHMVQGLFPHMNKHDRHAFLANMYKLQPEKFRVAWQNIRDLLAPEEWACFDAAQ